MGRHRVERRTEFADLVRPQARSVVINGDACAEIPLRQLMGRQGQLIDRVSDGPKDKEAHDQCREQRDGASHQHRLIDTIQRGLLDQRLAASPHHAIGPQHRTLTLARHHHLMKLPAGDLIGEDDHSAQPDGDDERKGEHQFPKEAEFHRNDFSAR